MAATIGWERNPLNRINLLGMVCPGPALRQRIDTMTVDLRRAVLALTRRSGALG